MLRKGVDPYENMDDWEKFYETKLAEKEEFYNKLNMKDIIDAGYTHAKRVCKDFEIKHFGDYHDLYLKSDTLLLADVFKIFRKMCLKISFSSWISMANSITKDLSKIRIIN